MPTRPPWHSVREPVHHNHSDCEAGKNIQRPEWHQGTGNKPLCEECAELTERERQERK